VKVVNLRHSDWQYHLRFWRREYSRRLLQGIVNKLSPASNQVVVRALEIAGQPHELDLIIPDTSRPKFLTRSHTLTSPVAMQIPAQGNLLGTDGHWWPPVRVHELKGVQLDVMSGLVFAEGRVVSQSGTGHRWARDAAFITGALRRVQAENIVEIAGSVAYLGQTNNYYHLMIETLPRLLRVRAIDPDVKFFTDSEIPEFAAKILTFAGLEDHILINPGVVEGDKVLLCEPSPLFFPHPENLRSLSKELRGWIHSDVDFNPSNSESIYISRSRSSRSPASEILLEDYLSSIGFDILYLEDLSIQDQITRFSAAKVVVAPHGAGLSNIVFLDEGARVLEYSAGEWWWPCFRRIAFGLGLDYEFLLLPAYPSAPNGRAEDAISLVRQALDKNRID
jgi:capsular polysaccharide biosynthesis protein